MKRSAVHALGLVALLCSSGCFTDRVSYIGRVRERSSYPRVLSVRLDDEAEELEVVYRGELLIGGGRTTREVTRRLLIPYSHLGSFDLGDIAGQPRVMVRGGESKYWWEEHPRFVKPENPWGPDEAADAARREAGHLSLSFVPMLTGGSGEAALNQVRKGHAVNVVDGVLLPWRGRVLYIPFPLRMGYVPGAKVGQVLLYPVAVAGDILLSPFYLVVILMAPKS